MRDIKKILSEHHIQFVEAGPNTGRGEISIACPMCKDDPSHHLGINLTTGYWHCWRNHRHSGKNLSRLFAILGIFLIEEKSETMQKLLNRTFFNKTSDIEVRQSHTKVTELPMGFIPIAEDTVLSRPYLRYLQKRGFINPMQVCKDYDLRRSIMADKWSGRLIIPIRVEDEVCWTGRAIGEASLRYLSPSAGETINIKSCLWNFNELKDSEGEALVLCEGPLDAMKIDWYNKLSVRATCLFGMGVSDDQLKLLNTLCSRYNNILIGLDDRTLSQSILVMKALYKFSPVIIRPENHKDFGEMNPEAIKTILAKHLEIS